MRVLLMMVLPLMIFGQVVEVKFKKKSMQHLNFTFSNEKNCKVGPKSGCVRIMDDGGIHTIFPSTIIVKDDKSIKKKDR